MTGVQTCALPISVDLTAEAADALAVGFEVGFVVAFTVLLVVGVGVGFLVAALALPPISENAITATRSFLNLDPI